MANRRCEPDRRITPPATDLEHFAVGLRRANREQDAPCRRLHANTGWPRFLDLDPLEDRTGAIVEHLGDVDLDDPRLDADRVGLDRADVKFGQRYASWSDDLDEASCQGGNGPPFTSTSIPIRPTRPTPAGAACPSRDAGRPSVRRARAART